MSLKSGRVWRGAMAGMLAAALLWISAQYLIQSDGWHEAMAWIMVQQAALHRQLAGAIRLVAEHGWAATWPLIGISLMYGVFHAAGPGHGKAVIATYLGTSATRLRRGLVLSVLSALLQGLVAIALVEIVVGMLGYSLRQAQGTATQLENLSFALVALLGGILVVRSLMALYRRWRQPPVAKGSLFAGNGKMQSYCADCGGFHRLGRAHLDQPLTWRTGVPLVLSIGLRPCTGAILVLLVAYSLGLRWVGIASVLAMSIGTALTVALLAGAVVALRKGLLQLLGMHTQPRPRLQLAFDLVGLAGGLLILGIGIALLRLGLASGSHPLF